MIHNSGQSSPTTTEKEIFHVLMETKPEGASAWRQLTL